MPADDQLFQRFGREFPKGHVLFRDGEPGREMYVVQSGKVNITKQVRNAELVLATLGPGEFFGEMALLSNQPRSAAAVMADNGRLLVVDPRNFEAMIRGNGEIAARLIKKLSDRLQDADEKIETLMLRDPASRVVHYLLRLAKKSGKDALSVMPELKVAPGHTPIFVELSPDEIPSRVGLRPEEAKEALNKAVKARILTLVPGGVLIAEVNKAKQYLEFLEMKESFGDK